MPAKEKEATKDELRKLIAGAFADFLIYLDTLYNPIIIGGNYPRDKLLKAFNDWTKERNFNTTNANLASWKELCLKGVMAIIYKER